MQPPLSPFLFEHVHTMSPFVHAGVFRRDQRTSNPRGLSFLPGGTHSVREAGLTRRLASLQLRCRPEDLRLIHQVHGDTIVYRGPREDDHRTIPDADAQWTDQKGLLLLVHVADCCPVIVTSEKAGLAGIAHAGWRGARLGVSSRLLTAMCTASSSDIRHFRAWIGPCAEARRYEVGPEFRDFFGDIPEAVVPHGDKPGRYLFDVKETIRQELLRAGVPADRISVHPGGTIGDLRYHSHRRDGFAAGRMAAFVMIGR
jgi:polyphenol oxidase